jgi:hypothetical protein
MRALLAFALLASAGPGLAVAGEAPADKVTRYTFSWPVGPDAPAPRGGTTRGPLQEPGLSSFERDRRAILAMAGSYRVAFDFLEIASFTGDGSRPRPYQSWGTEKVYVDEDDGRTIRLVHILEMRVVGADGKPGEPMVTKHWRQDWRYEPGYVIEHRGGETWARRTVNAADARGAWSQTVYQVDESPRYASVGRWEHNASFSTWISGDTARPLPRREWSVRKDYQFLYGTNRHTIVPTGWIQEENNLKGTGAPGEPSPGQPPFVGREYGVARYERISGSHFSAADAYYQSTRAFWNQVVAAWERAWQGTERITMRAHVDQSGEFAKLFELADRFAQGTLSGDAVRPAIHDALRSMGVPVPE